MHIHVHRRCNRRVNKPKSDGLTSNNLCLPVEILSTIERTKKKCRSWRERELLVGRSDVPSDFCFASDKERHFNSLDHGDEHSRHTLSDAPLVSVPKKNLKGNYNQTVLRFAKSNVNEAVFVTCFRICFLCVFPFKGSFVSPMTHATNRISTRNTHIRALMYTRRSTRFLDRDRSRFLGM